jgi:hypothetical protein
VLEVDELRREFQATGAARGFKIVDAGQARAALAAMTAGLPVEHLLFWCRIGGMPDSLVAEHLELLFGDVRRGLAADHGETPPPVTKKADQERPRG